MRIEHIESISYSTMVGELKIFDRDEHLIGVLEYSIKDNVLHVNNLKNHAPEQYSGVGTALMDTVLIICLNKKVGLGFDVARGSEGFYKSWVPRALNPAPNDTKTHNFFARLTSASSFALTGRALTYNPSQLSRSCRLDKEMEPLDCVRARSPTMRP